MKRDDDLLRQILLSSEEKEDFVIKATKSLNPPAGERARLYHLELLCDAGLMAKLSENSGNSYYRMTNTGHDYLAAIRSNTVWQKTKDGAAQVGGMTLGMMRDLAIAYAKQEIREKLGIDLT